MGNWNSGGGGGSAGDFDDSFNEAMGYTGGDFDEGDVGSTSVFGGGGGGSAGDFDEDFNYADYQDSQMDELDAISSVFSTLDKAYGDASRGNWLNAGKDYTVLDADMQVKNFSPYGRYGIEDTAFFAGAIGEYGLERDILGSAPQGFKDKAVDFVSNVASGVTERFGTSFRNNYAIDPSKGYIGEITEDYGFTDLIGNIIGLAVPGGAKVDRYSSRELTKTGLGQRQFGNYSIFGGGIKGGYAMTPEEEQAMFAAAQAEAEAERARGGGDPAVTPAVTTGVSPATSQQQLRSALLPSFMQTGSFAFNLLGPDLMPPVYDAAQDFFRSSTLASGGNYFGAFGFAGGGQAGAEQGSDSNVSGPVGFVGDVPEAVSEAGTVADDVPMEVEEGTYILNAAAVEFAGSDDIKKMILEAISEAQRQGVDMQPNVDRIKLDNQVSLLVSRGEVVIPPKIAKIIGYDRLEKINNRGKQEVEKRVQENGQSPEAEAIDKGPMNPAEGMAFAPGGRVTDGEVIEAMTPEQRINANMDPYREFSRLQLQEGGGGSTSQKGIPYGEVENQGFDVSGQYYGDGFIAGGGARGSRYDVSQSFPDGVVKNEEGESIGFTVNGEMFLSDDKALRAGMSRDASRNKTKFDIPTGETIEFGQGQKVKRYDMGATFGPLSADVFKEQGPGEDVSGGKVTYKFSDNGQLYVQGTEGGKSGEIGLRYNFSKGGKTPSKSDRYIRPDQREGGIDYSLEMLNLKKKFLEMHTDPPKMPEASEYNDRFAETQRPEAFTGSMLIDFENFLNTQLNTSEQGSSQYMMYQDLMDQAMEEASSQAIDQYYYYKGVEVDGTPTDMTDRDVTEQERVRKAVKEARDPDLAPSFLMT